MLVDFLPHGTTINGPYYASFLHRLHSSTWEKSREKLRCRMMLLHESAPVDKSIITQASPNWIILHIVQIRGGPLILTERN